MNWRHRAIRAAIHCSCKHSSIGGARVHRQNLAEDVGVAVHASSASTCGGCVSVHPDQLDAIERDALQEILEDDERLAFGYELLQRFRRLIARRSVHELDQWLEDAAASELRPFVSLSHGIQADRAAVVNGLTLPWSTGPVEGTVTKVKLIKRQGYGRASTNLLRRRIISAI